MALICLVGSIAQRPCAAREPFELTWSAPAECPSSAEVSAALARLAEKGSHVEAARVEIVRVAGRWQATLSTRGAQRRLEGESCAAVVHALTAVLALAAAESEPPPPPPAARPLGQPTSAPSPAAVVASEKLPADEPKPGISSAGTMGWSLRGGLLGELGMLPGPTLGPQAALALHLGRWSAELGATLLLPRHARLAGEGSPEGDIDWLGGQLAACRDLAAVFALCLGAEAGRLSGAGAGVDEPLSAAGWWLAASAGARLRGEFFRRGAFSWQLGLGAAAALQRPEFGFDELGVLHRPSAVSGRLFLGLGWGH